MSCLILLFVLFCAFHLAFGERVEDLDISSTDRLETIEEKIIHARHLQGSDCAEPIKDAIDMRRNDIDVFVYFTDSETR